MARMTGPTPRSDSDRELREIRLLWLLGYSVVQIARRLGRHRGTIWKRMKTHALDRDEEPLERARLALDCAHDRLAEQILESDDPGADIGPLIRMAGELRRLDSARRASAKASETPAPDDAHMEEDPIDDVRRSLAALASGLEEKSHPDGESRNPHPGTNPIPERQSLADQRPRYTGSAAGPLADMSVHGRTRRWQDPGWGGVAALVSAAGRVPPRGAGRADPA